MDVKLFELRDAGTFVPVMCVRVESSHDQERYLLRRCGCSMRDDPPMVIMSGLQGGEDKATCDPYDWGMNRTRQIAHKYIVEKWDDLKTGDVVDVEYILGERTTPKTSEKFDQYPF